MKAVRLTAIGQPLALQEVPVPQCGHGEVLVRIKAAGICHSDHPLQEFPLLIELARRGVLDLSHVVARTVPLAAGPINEALDALQQFAGEVRTVIVP